MCGDQPMRFLAVGTVAADSLKWRVASGDPRLPLLEYDQSRRDMNCVEVKLLRVREYRIRILDFRRRERARIPKGCGAPLAAADTRNLHQQANKRKSVKISSTVSC